MIRSDGSLIRDYFYIKDATKAYLMLGEALLDGRACGEAYNFSNEAQISVSSLVTLVAQLMGQSGLEPIALGNAKNKILNQYLSSEKARTQLGWKAEYSLEQGLQETIQWYWSFFRQRTSDQ